jgi:hypothetical protein
MKDGMILAMAAMCIATAASAQTNDRAQENKAAVRRMFPIVSVFDKRKPKVEAPAAAASTTSSETDTLRGATRDEYGASADMVARIRQMDVAGVRLGMTPEEAKAALRAKGYAPTPSTYYTDRRPETKNGYDYATRVDQIRRERLSDYRTAFKPVDVVTSETWSKGDEKVDVDYSVMKAGRRVASVGYHIPEGRMSWASMRSSIVEKYGRPTRLSENMGEIHYCADNACAFLLNGRHASLDLTGRWNLTLTDDGATGRMAAREIAADAERSIDKTDRPSF